MKSLPMFMAALSLGWLATPVHAEKEFLFDDGTTVPIVIHSTATVIGLAIQEQTFHAQFNSVGKAVSLPRNVLKELKKANGDLVVLEITIQGDQKQFIPIVKSLTTAP